MDWARSSGEDHTGLWWGNVKEGEYLEKVRLRAAIILWILGRNCWKCVTYHSDNHRFLVRLHFHCFHPLTFLPPLLEPEEIS